MNNRDLKLYSYIKGKGGGPTPPEPTHSNCYGYLTARGSYNSYIENFNGILIGGGDIALAVTDQNKNYIIFDYSKSFHIHVKVARMDDSKNGVFGGSGGWYDAPIIYADSYKGLSFGYSTTGSSHDGWLYISDREVPYEYGDFLLADLSWDTEKMIATITNGNISFTKTIDIGPHHSTAKHYNIGAINFTSGDLHNGIKIDFSDTYLEQDGIIIWGNKA